MAVEHAPELFIPAGVCPRCQKTANGPEDVARWATCEICGEIVCTRCFYWTVCNDEDCCDAYYVKKAFEKELCDEIGGRA